MKIKLKKLFYWSILIQILATQGVITFLVFDYFGNWEIKKFFHPFSFFLIIILFLIKASKRIKITLLDILFFGYFSLLFFTLLFNARNIESLYIVFREIYILFIMIFIFNQLEISEKKWSNILNLLFYLLILNSIFIILTFVLGPEKYMKMITGRYVWGIDPEYKFKISNFYNFWRSPALVGNAGSVGYFSVLSYLLMDQYSKFKKKKYIALFPLIFSFVRSAYLILIVYEFFKFFTKKKNLRKLILILKVAVPIVIFMTVYLANYDVFSTASLFERLYLWKNQISVNYNIFYGGEMGNVGGGARGSGFLETLDSYWLLMIISSGLIGIIISILFIYEKSKKNNKFLFILNAFFLAGFLVNLTQSIVFLVLFPMLFIKIKED
jgi:hypothetical protein